MKRLILLVVLLMVLFADANRALAFDAPILIYVDTAYVGPEVGTDPTKPFDTMTQAIAMAQSSKGGGLIMVKINGEYKPDRFVNSVTSGNTGIPLSGPALYGLLAILSVLVILVGWQLQRRSRRLQH